MTCKLCDKETKNGKYCSRACWKLDVHNPMRHKAICPNCGGEKSDRSKLCYKCAGTGKKSEHIINSCIGDKTYSEQKQRKVQSLASHARRKIKKLGWGSCFNCGYNYHVDAAHIKAVSDFDSSTKIVDINKEENLMSLCKNCHWEYDHKLLLIHTIMNNRVKYYD